MSQEQGTIDYPQRYINDIDGPNGPNEPEQSEDPKKFRDIEKDLEFYKSIFKTHHNSCLFNMKIKYLKGEKVWVDPTRDSREYISDLDIDSDTEEWLRPIKPER